MDLWRRALACLLAAAAVTLAAAGPAGACAGLVTPGGNIRLLRSATLAAHFDGVEHYVTSFTFAGGGAELGSLVPLPGRPTSIERGGDWTLQRLEREVRPAPEAAALRASAGADGGAEVVEQVRIDALELTVLRGGARAVGRWAREHGFVLTPDAPEVLEFYGRRSPWFMAARFDGAAARERGQEEGEGTPVHLTIPTDAPWVPLRILALGKGAAEVVEADVYLLTERRPALLPGPRPGMRVAHDAPARAELLDDLRADAGMGWVPAAAHLTHVAVSEAADGLVHDLAVDASGRGRPSAVAAGLEPPAPPAPPAPTTTVAAALPPTPGPVPGAGPATTLLAAPALPDAGRDGVAAGAGAMAVGLLALAAVGTVAAGRRP